MTVERDPVMDVILIGWVILVWCAFINLFIMVAICIVAGILVLGMLGMSVAFGFWPLAVGAAIALVFFALFAVVAKFLRKRIVEVFNPR